VLTDRETEELGGAIDRIWEIGREFGLDPFPTHFEVVPATIMYEFGAYGLPGRFSHWTHGKAFHQMKMMYDYGLSKIYELVINTNPCYGFLMENNSMVQNKLVVAHVMGHCDFFKNNVYFKHTSRQMIETASVNADRIRKYEYEHGERVVEEFLDAVLAIQEHIDPHLRTRHLSPEEIEAERRRRPPEGPYDDLWKLEERGKPAKEEERPRRRVPEEPEKDILSFLIKHAPDLDDWQRDVIGIVREEMLYFLPQMQTKIMNEGWACATGEALLATSRGFIRFRDLYEQEMRILVGSGEPGALHPITAFHKEEGVPTLRITTRRGYTLEGALKHRVRLADGSWAFLRDLGLGDRVALARGTEVWAAEEVRIEYQPEVLATTESARAEPPAALNAPMAYLLGYFVGAGTAAKSGICLTCDEEAHAHHLGDLIETTFGVPASVREDMEPSQKRWRVEVLSQGVARLFETLGVDLDARATARDVPDAILRSPRGVVSAFLRGCFDASGCAGPDGVTLSSPSDELVQSAQTLLLNYGILSARRAQTDGCARLEITGPSAVLFSDAIGHDLPCKRAALDAHLEGRGCSLQEEATDEIVAIEPGNADVYDITVDVAHAYVANGLINHNSFWHGRIMRELDLTDDEFIEYSQLNAGVLSPSPSRRQINPYYVGVKIWEDILRRWDSPTDEERNLYGREPGKGLEKLFEVRELDNDVSFLRNYLTEELVEELDLYIYELREDEWVITEKDWEKTRDMLVASMTNMGYPVIEVQDGDYRRNRELYLAHAYEGRELDIAYAEKALQHVYTLWGRAVHLETVVDGEPVLLTYDGHDNITRVLN
jgi:stage V sporulation protein R